MTEHRNAIDDSFGGELAAAALLIIGELDIVQGKYESTIKLASRAASSAETDVLREKAVVLLSTAYLLAEKYFAANQSLVENRGWIRTKKMVDVATFVSAYARMLSQEEHINEEPEDLLRSSQNLPLELVGFPHMHLLKGRALRVLGLQKQSVETLIESHTLLQESHLRSRVKAEISHSLFDAGPYSDLTRYYGEIFESTSEELTLPEMVRNARFEFDVKNYENCRALCQKVLASKPDPVVKRLALQLLGKVSESTGDHYSAAIFFSGVYDEKNIQQEGQPGDQ